MSSLFQKKLVVPARQIGLGTPYQPPGNPVAIPRTGTIDPYTVQNGPVSNIQTTQVNGNDFDFKPTRYYTYVQPASSGDNGFPTNLTGNGLIITATTQGQAGFPEALKIGIRFQQETQLLVDVFASPLILVFSGSPEQLRALANPLQNWRGIPFTNVYLTVDNGSNDSVTVTMMAFTDYPNDNLNAG